MRFNSLFLAASAAHMAFAAFAPSSSSNYTVVITSSRLLTITKTTTTTSTPVSTSLTLSANSTSSCNQDCWIVYPRFNEFRWAPASTSAVVVATIVLSVNNATNVTSTSTIYNTDFEDPFPGVTNPAGTQVSTLTVSDPVAGTNWSTVVAYPTPFVSYAYSWDVEGTYETTSADGATACITGNTATYTPIQLPSHPAIPFTCEANTSDPDPNGDYYRLTTAGIPDGNWSCNSPDFTGESGNGDWASILFPNVMPTGCKSEGVAPAMVLTIVKSLTDTVTNYFSSSMQAPKQAITTSQSVSSVSAAAIPQSTTSSPQPTSEKVTPASSRTSSPQAVISTEATTQAMLSTQQSSTKVSQEMSTASTPQVTQVSQVTPSSSITVVKSSTSQTIIAQPELSSQVSAAPLSAQPLTLSVGAAVITASPGSAIVYNGNTVAPGSAITVSNKVISLATGASALVVGSSTVPLAVPNPAVSQALPAISINSQAVTADSASHYVIGSQTLVPGSAITVSDTVISLATNAAAVVIGSSAMSLAAPVSPTSVALPVITFASQPITADSASHYVIGLQTLVPGSAITVSNTVISLATNAAVLAIGSSAISLAAPVSPTSVALPVVTFGSQRITANSASDYIIGSQTLVPGSAITISNTVINLATGASAVFIESSSIPLANPVPKASGAPPVFTMSDSIITANAASAFVFQSQTLTPGGPAITVSGAKLSLASNAGFIVDNTNTINLTPTPTGSASGTVGQTGTSAGLAGAATSGTGLGGQIIQPFTGGAGSFADGMLGRLSCISGLIIVALVI